jgi:hypothetical protein
LIWATGFKYLRRDVRGGPFCLFCWIVFFFPPNLIGFLRTGCMFCCADDSAALHRDMQRQAEASPKGSVTQRNALFNAGDAGTQNGRRKLSTARCGNPRVSRVVPEDLLWTPYRTQPAEQSRSRDPRSVSLPPSPTCLLRLFARSRSTDRST